MTTLIDTSVLIAITQPEDRFHEWAVQEFNVSKSRGPVLICDIVYCEFSIAMGDQSSLDNVVRSLALERLPATDTALFRAGRAYREYRRRRGTKHNVLPDFLIGALAETAGTPLVTSNQKDFLSYFPEIMVICPGN